MLLQGMEGGWVVIEASHTVISGLTVTCHMLNSKCVVGLGFMYVCMYFLYIVRIPS